MAKKNGNGTEEPLEKQLWKTADKLRKNIDAAEYKHIVLGLIFLKYISDAFEELYAKLKADVVNRADPEDKDEYKAENVFFVPKDARWNDLLSKAKQPDIGKFVDNAMDALEKENASLKGVLPKVFAKQNLDPTSLGELIDLVGNIALGDAKARSADVLGHVFEYFLGEFALAEGKKGGQFYTPRSVVELLVEMLEPYKGRVFDPCCGSGGMFVHSEGFVAEHRGRVNDISIYGQESNRTTWQLCKMNLAIRGIDSSQVKWNNEGSFLNDAHKDLKADYIMANPPFNVSDWGGDLMRKDGRWQYGTPPTGNANFAWMQHFIYHLAPRGKAAIVMHCSAASNKSQSESSIRKELVKSGMVDCMVALPTQLFTNTTLPVHIWILNRSTEKKSNILMIDAYSIGKMRESTIRELEPKDISEIANTYHKWKNKNVFDNIPGFCKSVTIEEVESKNYILSPNRYVERIKKKRDMPFHSLIEKNLAFSRENSIGIINSIENINLNKDKFKLDHLKNFDLSFDKSGWEPTEISEIIDSTISGNWGNEEQKKDNIPVYVIRGTDLPNIPLYNLKKTPKRFLHKEKVLELQLKENDIIIEMSGGSKDQPTGRCAIVTKQLLDYFEYPLVCSNFCKVIRIKAEKIDPFWFYLYWNQAYLEGITTKYENQPSGIKNFQLDEFVTSELILIPPKKVQEKYSVYLREVFDLKSKMSFLNYNLSKILDTSFENLYYDFDKN